MLNIDEGMMIQLNEKEPNELSVLFYTFSLLVKTCHPQYPQCNSILLTAGTQSSYASSGSCSMDPLQSQAEMRSGYRGLISGLVP